MGVSYALAAIGYFMLLELFAKVSQDTRPLVVLVGLTGLPVLLDVVGYASPLLVDIGYEPLGVAVFAVGVLYGYTEQFQAIRLAGSREGPVVVVSDADRIREVNDAAIELFPELEKGEVVGEPLADVLPGLADAVDEDESIVTIERNGSRRYYRITESPFTGGGNAALGRLLTLTDITHRERYRRELERQNDRLNQFAEMVSHDLRNPLTVANGQLEVARERLGDDESLDEVATAHERIETIVENVLALARQGQPIDETEPVTLSGIATDCWGMVDTDGHHVEFERDATFDADADRLSSLFENLFRNAIEHGDGETTVTVGALADGDGFFVADDGPGIPEADRESVFESGFTTAAEGTGFGLAIVKEVVEAHGWTIDVTESESGGARFEVRGVTPAA
jgi:signal transduction histidine kinase